MSTELQFPQSFNPVSPEHVNDPFPLFARARREAPVFFSPIFGCWIVTRYEDVSVVAKDYKRFSSKVPMFDLHPSVLEAYPEVDDVPSLVDADPPEHTRLRSHLTRLFSPQNIERKEPEVRRIVNDLVDGFIADGHLDVMASFSKELPLLVVVEMIGAPAEDRHRISEGCDQWLLLNARGQSIEEQMTHAAGKVAFLNYVRDLVAARRREPRDDITSHMLTPDPGGAPMPSDATIVSAIMQLFFGGHETLKSLIALCLWNLLSHPEQAHAVRENRSLIPLAVEETLRIDALFQSMFRVTTEDVELSGVRIPKGERVLFFMSSANRDEEQFPDPDVFNIHREGLSQHLAFGRGPHFCIGSALTRLELRVMLDVLLERLPNLRLRPGQQVPFASNLLLRGPTRLDIEWDPPGASART